MSKSKSRTDSSGSQSTIVTLKIWHPNCWTLQITDELDAGLIGHAVYEIDGVIQVRFTVYADSTAEIDRLIDEIEASDLTFRCRLVNECFNTNVNHESAGNATRKILVEYEPKNSIHDAIVSQGLVPEGPIRIHDGYEYWTVVSDTRDELQHRLDAIRDEMDAEITVQGMQSTMAMSEGAVGKDELSERQREVFQFAQQSGYYSWPRQVSASEIADELSVSKTTVLEHLRKAESKLLGDIQI